MAVCVVDTDMYKTYLTYINTQLQNTTIYTKFDILSKLENINAQALRYNYGLKIIIYFFNNF